MTTPRFTISVLCLLGLFCGCDKPCGCDNPPIFTATPHVSEGKTNFYYITIYDPKTRITVRITGLPYE